VKKEYKDPDFVFFFQV